MVSVLVALVMAVGTSGILNAHPLAVTSCDVQVSESKIAVTLNILVADLVIYQNLKPKDNGKYYDYTETIEAGKIHQSFLLDYFIVRDEDGKRLDGEITNIDFSALDGKKATGVRPVEAMRYAIDYTIEYPLEAPPEFLNFSQIFGGENNPQPETMELLVHRDGVLVELSQKIGPKVPHIVRFDWSQPAEPIPNDWKIRKKRAEQQMLESLGMPQFSGVYSHLYIEDAEVRMEIILPLVILETFLPFEKKDPDFLEVTEQLEARKKIESWFKTKHPVVIDGKRVIPELYRVDYFPLETRDFMAPPKIERVSTYNSRIGIIARYPVSKTPDKIRYQWDGFSRILPYLKLNIYEFDGNPIYKYLIEEENVVVWERKGSSVQLTESGIKGHLFFPGTLIADGFENDPDVDGRIICPNTKAAEEYWTNLWNKALSARINGTEKSLPITKIAFHDLDFEELPLGSLSGKVDLTEVRILTEFELPHELSGNASLKSFVIDWEVLDKITPRPLTRLMFQSPNRGEIPVVFNPGENALSWSIEYGAGPGLLFSLPSPPSPKMISAPRYPVLFGLSVMTIIWALAIWGQFKFKPHPRAISAGIIGIILVILTLSAGTEKVPSPFSGPPEISDAEKERVFQGLHRNIYRAFRLPGESSRYDALAQVTTGEFLNDLYLEIQKSLVNASSGGAMARIDSVSILEAKPEGKIPDRKDGFRIQSSWEVAGTVEHWGHIHTRTNHYTADFDITTVSNQWKLLSYSLTDQKQVGKPYVGLRMGR